MNTNKLLTIAAVGMAVLAVWYLTRKPGASASTLTGQQQPLNMSWLGILDAQGGDLYDQAFGI